MLRRLFTLFSALSLLLCVAVVALRVRSSEAFDHVRWRYDVDVAPHERDERSLHVVSVRGRLFMGSSREQYSPFPPWEGWRQPHPRPGVTRTTSYHRPGWANFELDVHGSFDQRPGPRPFGFGVGRIWSMSFHGGPTRRFDAVAAPHELVAFALALPSLCSAMWRWRRRRWRRPGFWPACGYGLRATLGRGPSCGRGVGDGHRQQSATGSCSTAGEGHEMPPQCP